MLRPAVTLVLAVGTLAGMAPVAHAQLDGQSFGAPVVGAPALGVAGDGQAVLAWSGSGAIFASVRSAGGPFGARTKLSTGGNASAAFALGVGHRGDAIVVWQHAGGAGPFYASVRRASGRFRDPVQVPGSSDGRSPAAAADQDGTLLVAWRRHAAPGCGYQVMAAIARPGKSFGAAHRVSGSCPNAALVRTAMSGDGRGTVAWRTGRARDAYAIDAAVAGRSQVGVVRHVSHRPVVGLDLEIAGSNTGTLLVWRDRIAGSPKGSSGRVVASNVTASGMGAVIRVSAGENVVGVPRVSLGPTAPESSHGRRAWCQPACWPRRARPPVPRSRHPHLSTPAGRSTPAAPTPHPLATHAGPPQSYSSPRA